MTVSRFMSEKEKENCCLPFTFSIKSETTKFHVVVVQQGQRNVQKSVLLVQSCCFTNNLYFFCRFRYRRRRHCSVSPFSISPQWMPILMKRTGRLLFLEEDRTHLQFLSCTTSTENKQCLQWSLTGG